MANKVNAIVVRNSYKEQNELFKSDADGDLIVFSNDYNTENTTVKDILILIRKDIDKTEITRLLSKVIDNLTQKP